MRGEVPLCLRHGPEKDVHRFSGCLIGSLTLTIRPLVKSLFATTGESYTLRASQARSAKGFGQTPRVALTASRPVDWTFLTIGHF